MIRFFCFIIILTTCCLKNANSQENSESTMCYYSQAMEFLTGKNHVGKSTANYSKIRVSPQVVPFDVLGWFFQSELSKKTKGEYSPSGSFQESDYKNNDYLESYSRFKKKSKYLIFFTEPRDGFLLAEVIRESNSSDYLASTMFSQGTVFLFEYSNGKLENVSKKKVYHN